VNEAWQQGLDAIAITDHIEYRPYKNQVLGDLNESYQIAKNRADQIGFIVIKGAEITRAKPLGHLNALFINDANKLDVKDP
jgi:histidinol phosphatase-like PHP family hydrolase